ncbi:uncharacterized protein LOC120358281 [Solenopsis invicta]|uniref:uncharacterized protein LOC120358281 n=1 Tax=Solenopsis invicta TaxID=13686 RepID=UPI00193E0F63|nr:uncharacterized protein LOC120358281 [Solenopsis invicta]
MGDLPGPRVSGTRAFINVGVDYGGPFNLKLSRNKSCKAYKLSHKEIIERYCSKNAIQWHFIPSYSPHMGGIWKAGIKSVKTHLRKILGEALLTFEEMYTILTQTEAVLNSRPLTPVSANPDDLRALTPGHFLIGAPLNAIPQCSLLEQSVNQLTQFQYLTKLVQFFWFGWSTEYLSNLQQRMKWNREDTVSPVRIGSMVILCEDHVPSMQWPLGRIIECHPERDNKCRVISIRTAKGIVTRAISKICILPIDIE